MWHVLFDELLPVFRVELAGEQWRGRGEERWGVAWCFDDGAWYGSIDMGHGSRMAMMVMVAWWRGDGLMTHGRMEHVLGLVCGYMNAQRGRGRIKSD